MRVFQPKAKPSRYDNIFPIMNHALFHFWGGRKYEAVS
jgi:hypothetical protein